MVIFTVYSISHLISVRFLFDWLLFTQQQKLRLLRSFFDNFRLFHSNQYCRQMNGAPRTEILSPAGKKGVWNACVCLHYFIICCQSFGCRGSDYQKYYQAIDRAGKSVKRGSDMLMERGRALIAGAA